MVFSGTVAGQQPGRVRRAAARRAPLLRRDPGAPRAALPPDPPAPAVRRPGRCRDRAAEGAAVPDRRDRAAARGRRGRRLARHATVRSGRAAPGTACPPRSADPCVRRAARPRVGEVPGPVQPLVVAGRRAHVADHAAQGEQPATGDAGDLVEVAVRPRDEELVLDWPPEAARERGCRGTGRHLPVPPEPLPGLGLGLLDRARGASRPTRAGGRPGRGPGPAARSPRPRRTGPGRRAAP